MATLQLVAEEIDGEDVSRTLEVCGLERDEVSLQFAVLDGLDTRTFCITSIEDITQLIGYCANYLEMHKDGELG